MFNQIKMSSRLLAWTAREQPIAFSNAENLYTDLILLRDEVIQMEGVTNEMIIYLNKFIEFFDKKLYKTVSDILTKWQEDGTLNIIINEALQWELDDFKVITDQNFLSVERQFQQIEYNAKDLGVVGDGLTDDTLALQNAVNISKSSKLKLSKNSNIKLSDTITIELTDSVTIDGDGSKLELNNGRLALNVINIPYKVDQISSLTTNQTDLTLSSVEGISVGDGLIIKSTEVFAERVGYVDNYKKGFTTKVRDIINNTLIIDPIPFAFNQGYQIELRFYKNNTLSLKNLTIINNGDGLNKNSLRIQNVFNGLLENITLLNDDYTGLTLSNVCDFNVSNLSVGSGSQDNIELNYGVFIEGATNTLLDGLDISTKRHCVSLTNTPCVNLVVTNSNLKSLNGSPIDSHCSWEYKVRNSNLYGSLTLGIGLMTLENCYLYLDDVGQFGISMRQDVSKTLRGLVFKNNTVKINSPTTPFYLFKLADVHTENVGLIDISNNTFVSDIHISTFIALRHSKLSDSFGDVYVSGNLFKCDFTILLGYYGDTSAISVGNQNKAKCHIDNNYFNKVNNISNALNLFSIFTVNGNVFDSASVINVRPYTIGFINAVTHISKNTLQQGSLYIDGLSNVYVVDNVIHYSDAKSVVTRCPIATIVRNLLNGSQYIDLAGNEDNMIQVGWNRRLGRVDTNAITNQPTTLIDLE